MFEGGWVREWRALADGPRSERCYVLWLQVGRYFADVRTPNDFHEVAHPLDLAQGVSGTVSQEGDVVVWHHDIDTLDHPPWHSDTAVMAKDGSDHLVERGDGYVECWRRVESADAPAIVLECGAGSSGPDARVVRVGGLATAVWRFGGAGAAVFSADAGWDPTRLVGKTLALDALHEVVAALDLDARLPEGWRRIERIASA